eukprot:ctg_282.g113
MEWAGATKPIRAGASVSDAPVEGMAAVKRPRSGGAVGLTSTRGGSTLPHNNRPSIYPDRALCATRSHSCSRRHFRGDGGRAVRVVGRSRPQRAARATGAAIVGAPPTREGSCRWEAHTHTQREIARKGSPGQVYHPRVGYLGARNGRDGPVVAGRPGAGAVRHGIAERICGGVGQLPGRSVSGGGGGGAGGDRRRSLLRAAGALYGPGVLSRRTGGGDTRTADPAAAAAGRCGARGADAPVGPGGRRRSPITVVVQTAGARATRPPAAVPRGVQIDALRFARQRHPPPDRRIRHGDTHRGGDDAGEGARRQVRAGRHPGRHPAAAHLRRLSGDQTARVGASTRARLHSALHRGGAGRRPHRCLQGRRRRHRQRGVATTMAAAADTRCPLRHRTGVRGGVGAAEQREKSVCGGERRSRSALRGILVQGAAVAPLPGGARRHPAGGVSAAVRHVLCQTGAAAVAHRRRAAVRRQRYAGARRVASVAGGRSGHRQEPAPAVCGAAESARRDHHRRGHHQRRPDGDRGARGRHRRMGPGGRRVGAGRWRPVLHR